MRTCPVCGASDCPLPVDPDGLRQHFARLDAADADISRRLPAPSWGEAVQRYTSRCAVGRMRDGVRPHGDGPDSWEEDFGDPLTPASLRRQMRPGPPWWAWMALGAGMALMAVVIGGAL